MSISKTWEILIRSVDLSMSVSCLWYCTVVSKMLQLAKSEERVQKISILFFTTAYKFTVISVQISIKKQPCFLPYLLGKKQNKTKHNKSKS